MPDETKHAPTDPRPGQEWYQSAVIYELDVKNFQDSDGDGCGDFPGLISRLDYVRDLGVDCVWLQPFYLSPRQDNGYDVADYRRVDPQLGTTDDFDRFVREARARGLKVIIDLPLNHTSVEHHWFQAARADRNSPYRDYYVWADELPANPAPYPVFGPEQGGNWEWDARAGQFYFHTFYKFMPDVNMANPRVRDELLDVARFWLGRGVHGFRLDAVPFLIKDTSHAEHLEEPHRFLKDLHRVVEEARPDGILLAEANLKPAEMKPYFGDGDGDEMHLLLNFYLCNHLFLAVATGEAEPVGRAWNELPEIPRRCQWGNFLRNHDELSLDQLTEAERERVYQAFAPEEHMRAYGRGIRRRLAPMLGGDQRRVELMYSLLFSTPDTPILNAGEELGLGDDLRLKERESSRTPMQWSADQPNGGFSTADPSRLVRPVIADGPFAYQRVNVAAQERDPRSLLNFVRRAVRTYKANPAFGRGAWAFLKADDPGVLVHRCEMDGRRVYAAHNLAAEPKAARADLPDGLADVLSDGEYEPVRGGRVHLRPYGYRWLRPREEI